MEKKKGVIERVDLQGVNTYDDESFEPSLINFFYGKNGMYLSIENCATFQLKIAPLKKGCYSSLYVE